VITDGPAVRVADVLRQPEHAARAAMMQPALLAMADALRDENLSINLLDMAEPADQDISGSDHKRRLRRLM